MNRCCLLLAAAAIGASASAPASAACILHKIGELPVTMDGLTPTVAVKINGADVRMIADSGAWFGQLTPQAAARLKLRIGPLEGADLEGLGGAEQAGAAKTRDFTILGYTFHDTDFVVASPQLAPLDGLIGNNLFSFADTEFDLANGVIRLFKPVGCSQNTNLAYWAAQTGAYDSVPMPAAAPPDFKILVHVQVNGHDMTAIVDSGAGRSYISRDAAKTAGVTVNTAGVRTAGVGYGIGRHPVNAWTATFQTFRIGDEEVKNAVLEIGDGQLSDADMLIGADFLLSHRVYVANSEHKLFFSYLGGPVFNLDQAPTAKGTGAAPPAAAVAGAPTDSPADAASFSRRGAAFAARRDYVDAIADFTRAAALEPASAQPFYDRGMAHWRNGEPAAARADFDSALKLDPKQADALLARGELRLNAKDDGGAAADFDAARQIDPDDLPAIGADYAEAGRFEPALAAYDQWIAVNPRVQQRPPARSTAAAGRGSCGARTSTGLWPTATPHCGGRGTIRPSWTPAATPSCGLDRPRRPSPTTTPPCTSIRSRRRRSTAAAWRSCAWGARAKATPTSPRPPPSRRDCRPGQRRRASRRSGGAGTVLSQPNYPNTRSSRRKSGPRQAVVKAHHKGHKGHKALRVLRDLGG
jgi:tetratricopeptide (TPR) repeat protein